MVHRHRSAYLPSSVIGATWAMLIPSKYELIHSVGQVEVLSFKFLHVVSFPGQRQCLLDYNLIKEHASLAGSRSRGKLDKFSALLAKEDPN